MKRLEIVLAALCIVAVAAPASAEVLDQIDIDTGRQKSIREGFGLTVSEALWKKRPVIDSRVLVEKMTPLTTLSTMF